MSAPAASPITPLLTADFTSAWLTHAGWEAYGDPDYPWCETGILHGGWFKRPFGLLRWTEAIELQLELDGSGSDPERTGASRTLRTKLIELLAAGDWQPVQLQSGLCSFWRPPADRKVASDPLHWTRALELQFEWTEASLREEASS